MTARTVPWTPSWLQLRILPVRTSSINGRNTTKRNLTRTEVICSSSANLPSDPLCRFKHSMFLRFDLPILTFNLQISYSHTYLEYAKIHLQEKDKNHQWRWYRVKRYTNQRCGQPDDNTHERWWAWCFSSHQAPLYRLTLLASFLFNLLAIASRRSTPKCHGFIRTVSFISAKTNILIRVDADNY